jgi:drug/metabolite transporter (DMT)-like permease
VADDDEQMTEGHTSFGYAAALGSAALVGLFTVLNKWLLSEQLPALTAAAYTYAAAGLSLLPWALRAGGLNAKRPLVIAGWLLAGSVVGPAFYFLGLKLTSGVQGVLMINMEAVFTAFLAFVIFKEPVNAITAVAGVAVLAGGICIAWPTSAGRLLAGHTLGDLLMAIGYLGWATENNLGKLLGENIPPVTLVCVKALVAGVMMALFALAFHQSMFVQWRVVPGIILSGAVALGMSLALFYLAMRQIGAGRTGLIASTSTLWGVMASLIFLRESLSVQIVLGGLLMLIGLAGFAWETRRTMSR